MDKKVVSFFITLLFFATGFSQSTKAITDFPIVAQGTPATILYDGQGSSLDSITAHLLAADLYRITGHTPRVAPNAGTVTENCIVIGELRSDFIKNFLPAESVPDNFREQKESYLLKTVANPFSATHQMLLIAGTDPRGTAYGVFDISEKIGVSPWYWWADVPIQKRIELNLEEKEYFSKEPSVEYRGIFLNDEDWGLQPWAAKTFEPEVGDIGPKTYSKIFELLLRLRANTIWPAMHPSTKAFFHYPGNPKMAKKYHIVVGTSHAEPMLRNNVDEWKEDLFGDFDYISNKEQVSRYWEERIKGSKGMDAIYTMGIRGIHDSGMLGAKNTEEAVQALSEVLEDQRTLLRKHINDTVSKIPQVFTVYKEVLELYDHGLALPEDITIMWTDDNYGYIRRLDNDLEHQRKGGGGVYYHVSYWGRPHDYLWLNTTHPGLVREEMMKAYGTGNKKIWILNVGDIKPAEYPTQLFLDMAYDAEKFEDPSFVREHMESFYTTIFGKENGKKITALQSKYYDLAFERRPEFMGWSQTEPTTNVNLTAYDPHAWGDEINTRLEAYSTLEEQTERIFGQIPLEAQDTYFQLVHYPVKAASFMNKKWLYRDLALKYSLEGRLSSKEYASQSRNYYDSIVGITKWYNTGMAGGKWAHMMDMAPRDLPVFEAPEPSMLRDHHFSDPVGIAIENGSSLKDGLLLPTFYTNWDESHFLDIFLTKPQSVSWTLKKLPNWVRTNKSKGILVPKAAQQRITLSVDREKWEKAGKPEETTLRLILGEQVHLLQLKVKWYDLSPPAQNVFLEKNGIVSIYAENFTNRSANGKFGWEILPDLGYSGNLVQAFPLTEKPLDTLQLETRSSYLEYDIVTAHAAKDAVLVLNALPTHPLTKSHGVRIGVQWNGDPIRIVDFRTYGRSPEWKDNVLRNLATVKLPVEVSEKGRQHLKIYMIDEGVALDFFYLVLQGDKLPYSLLPETRWKE